MAKDRRRADWTLAGPPDAILRAHAAPRRPFSVVRYWMPGMTLGVLLAACGVWLSIANDELGTGWWGLMAGIGAPLGYLLTMKRAIHRVMVVVSVLSAALVVPFVIWWGTHGLVVCAANAAVSVAFAVGGLLCGLTLREVARGRWYHAQFLP